MTMNPMQIKEMKKEIALDEIRAMLAFDSKVRNSIKAEEDDGKQHYRFDMTGYDASENDASENCTVHNLFVLNKFAFLGIYNYTQFLTIDFYKGNGTLYFKYWNQDEVSEVDLSGLGTCEIIYKIFELTIFTNKLQRRH